MHTFRAGIRTELVGARVAAPGRLATNTRKAVAAAKTACVVASGAHTSGRRRALRSLSDLRALRQHLSLHPADRRPAIQHDELPTRVEAPQPGCWDSLHDGPCTSQDLDTVAPHRRLPSDTTLAEDPAGQQAAAAAVDAAARAGASSDEDLYELALLQRRPDLIQAHVDTGLPRDQAHIVAHHGATGIQALPARHHDHHTRQPPAQRCREVLHGGTILVSRSHMSMAQCKRRVDITNRNRLDQTLNVSVIEAQCRCRGKICTQGRCARRDIGKIVTGMGEFRHRALHVVVRLCESDLRAVLREEQLQLVSALQVPNNVSFAILENLFPICRLRSVDAEGSLQPAATLSSQGDGPMLWWSQHDHHPTA
mmetsp:Transcript_84437/g.272988  ORF Transcript_84437/g.272988 Transcript_84437/m.272988 type:complete len:367 (+) Transcript_84437:326-1426(+)